MISEDKRLIEVAFPLKQVSLDSVHEKNVRHGHISTLHIWPARRPLAACRAALIATLLPDPGSTEERKAILERMAGRIIGRPERKRVNGRVVERVKEETEGGILHWGREKEPDLEWFRAEIRKAYGGRAPKVLDPFAGGGAIPLEAMRLGCEVTAMDINPVAWFILKCTLEYPQRLAGQTRPLPGFAVQDREFMEAFLKAKGIKGARLRSLLDRLGHGDGSGVQLDALPGGDRIDSADLAWHVRAWGRWVLARARKELASCYPTYAEFEALEAGRGLRAPAHAAAGGRRRGRAPGRSPQRRIRRGLSEEPAQPALGRQAGGGLSLGAHRGLQAVPGRAAPVEDPLAVQEGPEASAVDHGAQGRPDPASSSVCRARWRRTAATARSGGNTTGASARAPCLAPAPPAPAAAPSRPWRTSVWKAAPDG